VGDVQGLYAIVDIPHPHGLTAAEVTRAVLADRLDGGEHGAAVVQLRAKEASTAERIEMLRTMAPLCVRARVPLFINDDVEAAFAGIAGVTGVHLGRDDEGARDVASLRARVASSGAPRLHVGLSTHDLRQLREAGRQAPDYLAFGPVCSTQSKDNPDPVVGLDGLLDACRLAMRPLVAIGGLDEDTGRRAMEAGAAAVAMIGALVDRTGEAIASRARHLAQIMARAAATLPFDEVQRRVPVLSAEQLVELAQFSDDVGMHIELGLPARFRPRLSAGVPQYRSCDVLDVLHALNKRPGETWEQWRERTGSHIEPGPVVKIRSR
jgi:thiamine-phosphate pyrophosphorylase